MKTFARVTAILATALTLASTGALAHDDAYLDTLKAPNGGQVRMAGVYHFELVMVKDSKDAKENPLTVYVTDHAGSKIATAGSSGTATILAGKSKTKLTLTADGENRFKASAKYASNPATKVVLTITMAGKPAESARFTPFAAPKDGHMDHQH